MRLTVHLKRVKKELIDGKYKIKNTFAYMVKDEDEAKNFVASINGKKPRNNVAKWYLTNLK